MNREELLEALKIRYTDLEVTLLFPEPVSVPRYKVSALRGGMGQVLLGQHCIRDENCEACDFAAECLIQRNPVFPVRNPAPVRPEGKQHRLCD